MFGGDAGGARVDAGEEFGGERRDDEQDGAGAAEAEVAGGEVGAVTEFARGFADPFGGGLGDAPAPFAAEDEGDGGLGDSGDLGDIAAGGARATWCHRGPALSSGLLDSAHGTYGGRRYTYNLPSGRLTDGDEAHKKGRGMAAGYLEILRARHAARLLTGTLVGRLPNATAAIAVVLFVRAEGGTYSFAGALAAVYGVANAVGQPLLGRLVDLRGQPRVQLPAAIVSGLAMAGFALAGVASPVLAYAAMIVAGLFTPPLEGGLRALWPVVLRRDAQVPTAYALDAVAQEVMFTVGPLLVTACVALWSARVALVVINVIGVLGALSVVVSPPSRAWRSGPREAHWLGALRSPGLLALLGAFLFVGIALGSITVAAVSYADGHGGDGVYGWLMAALGLGALVGGTAYGCGSGPVRRSGDCVCL